MLRHAFYSIRKIDKTLAFCTVIPYTDLSMKIGSIRHKGLRRFLEKNDPSGLPQDRLERIRRIVTALIAATSIEQMNTMPGWKLHPLKGSRAGIYAIAVSGNWRLTFWIKDNEIFDLELENYH